ncbi:unnamed protein product [Lathyrus oleraceus]
MIHWNTRMLWTFAHATEEASHRPGDKCPNGGDTCHHRIATTFELKANETGITHLICSKSFSLFSKYSELLCNSLHTLCSHLTGEYGGLRPTAVAPPSSPANPQPKRQK